MGGICGFIGIENGSLLDLELMTEKIKHRGPNCYDTYSDRNLCVGFRRINAELAADDCSDLFYENDDLVVFFDGEIYNKSMTMPGAEYIARLYEKSGARFLSGLRGGF